MGNNSAYTIFEETVIGAYDLGKLDKPLLKVLMEPYRGCDIDSGGEQGLVTKDGLDVVGVVLKTMGVKTPERPNLPKDYSKWTQEQEDANETYNETRWKAFRKITDQFGW